MKHILYFQFMGWEPDEVIERIVEVEVSDSDMGIDPTIDKLHCPLHLIAHANKVYDLTSRTVIKDRESGIERPVTFYEISELILKPPALLEHLIEIVNNRWNSK